VCGDVPGGGSAQPAVARDQAGHRRAGRRGRAASTTATGTHAITRAYVNTFFDQHLRCGRQPLLDRTVHALPEVDFCR
jgi:hypothetical protein